jgi:apolipoprotein N-acyltransferase
MRQSSIPTDSLSLATVQRWCAQHLAGRRLHAAAWALGVVSVLAFAPFHLWPILFVTLPAWLVLAAIGELRPAPPNRFARWRRSAIGRAGEVGWWFGFGYFMAGLFWVGEAFLVEPDVFGWLLPFAVTGLPAGLALFFGAAMAAAAAFAQHSVARVVALAVTLSVAEWLRGHILTGFPWNILGYALTQPLPLMQSAAVVGIYGLTLIAVLVFALPAALYLERDPTSVGLSRYVWLVPAVLPLAVMWAYGAARLSPVAAVAPTSVVVRVVQPSVLQREKWRPEMQRRIFDDHLELSRQRADGTYDGAEGIALIVWPEAAMPFFPLNSEIAMADIGRMLPATTTLLSGAMRADPPPAPEARRLVFNSLMAFGAGHRASVLGIYDKIHLVPFGEYLPMSWILEHIGLENLSRHRGGFATGVVPRPLMDVPRIGRIGPLICYEALFPTAIVQTAERPRLLVNVTNDGWFGNTTGPRQHLHQTRVRAVEEGLPIVRSANNGISAMIDSYGRITGRLDLNVRGSFDAGLPDALSPPLYARLGDSLFLALAMAATAIAFILRRSAQGR